MVSERLGLSAVVLLVAAATACATSSDAASVPVASAASPANTAPAVDPASASAPLMAEKPTLLIDPSSHAHRPQVPRGLPVRYRQFQLKTCLSQTGDVTGVEVMKGEEPEVNAEVVAKLKTWRYRPYTVDGQPVPGCFKMVLDMSQDGAARPPPAPVTLPPQEAQAHRLNDPASTRFPPARDPEPSAAQVGVVKVCVSEAGAVTSVKVVNPVTPELRDDVVATVTSWRYRPYEVKEGRAAPVAGSAHAPR
jgi:hypothetical protein